MKMHRSDVTIVVVPRERFSFTGRSLESVYAHTPGLERLVYVDGGSPAPVRRYLERDAVNRGFTHVRIERYLSPNEARNIGMRYVQTPFVVFLDNDVLVAPDWLDHLLACARETDAAIVGPLYQIDIGGHVSIHMAGGDAHIVHDRGKRVCVEAHRHGGAPPSLGTTLAREQCELVEFHSMLVRTSLLAALGPLDEGLRSVNEHVDLCMNARERGHSVYFEPKSVVTYVPATRLHASDLPFFMLRWSERWNRSTSHHFNAKWRLDRTHAKNRWIVEYGRFHRCRGLGLVREQTVSTWGAWFRHRIVFLVERCFNVAYTALPLTQSR